MKKEIKHFEEMRLENLASIKGGTLATWNENSAASSTYPNGDNIDYTETPSQTGCEAGVGIKQDGIGGGTCIMMPTSGFVAC